ncbi:MAG: aldehyde dehydrogenase family protein [Pseudomonadota bacterium]
MSGAPDSARVDVKKTYKLYIGGAFPRSESGRYFVVNDADGKPLANASLASRKDFREAVRAARGAQPRWAAASAYLRGQILYRCAEMLAGRSAQFESELTAMGASSDAARAEVNDTVDLLVYYAGWCDKVTQVFSSVNPVSSSHFNFSLPEPTGVVGVLAPQPQPLFGLVAHVAPVLAGGNACVALAAADRPLSAISFAEVVHSSDVPGGVLNILTGQAAELAEHFGSHMDVNAVVYAGADEGVATTLATAAAGNVKRMVDRRKDAAGPSPYRILDTLEIKTTWHPIER